MNIHNTLGYSATYFNNTDRIVNVVQNTAIIDAYYYMFIINYY
jgi:hypothetical protein